MNCSSNTQIHLPRRDHVQYLHGKERSWIELSTREEVLTGEFSSPTGVRFRQIHSSEKGLRKLHLVVRQDVLPAIRAFWTTMLKARAEQKEKLLIVHVGPGQSIEFEGVEDGIALDQTYSGYHICIYIKDWEAAYCRFLERNLLFLDHSFDDKFSTLEQARLAQQFRAKDVTVKEKVVVFELELEIRSMSHPQFKMKRYVAH